MFRRDRRGRGASCRSGRACSGRGVMRTRAPGKSRRLSSRVSRVGMSRSFVGSSRRRRSAGASMRWAMEMRALSPPERREIDMSRRSGEKRKRLHHPLTWIGLAAERDVIAIGREGLSKGEVRGEVLRDVDRNRRFSGRRPV